MRILLALFLLLPLTGCRTAVIHDVHEDDMQTVVTVEERPKSDKNDKNIVVDDRR